MFAYIRNEIAIRSTHHPSDIFYCHHYFAWVIGDDWGPRCISHLSELSSKRCGAVLYCHTLARPAYCPFCLGNQQLASSRRMQSWSRDHQAVRHVARHLQDCHYAMACPHSLCETSLPDSTSLRYHFIDDHGMSAKLLKDITPKNQLATVLDSFVARDPSETLKRRNSDRSRPEKPSKRIRGAVATKSPLCTTSTEVEHPHSAHSSTDEVVATEDVWSQDVFSDDCDDLFAEFLHIPTSSDSRDETVLEHDLFMEPIYTSTFSDAGDGTAVEQDLSAKQCSLLQGMGREDDQQLTEPRKILSTIRIRLRVPSPKPKITLRPMNPKAKKGRKPIAKHQWMKQR